MKAVENDSASTFRWLLILAVVLVLAATLAPFDHLVAHGHWSRVRWIPWQGAQLTAPYIFDWVGNVLLFAPIGFLLVRSRSVSSWWAAAAWALLLSTFIEGLQVFSHAREPGTNDICMNVLGGAIGARVAERFEAARKLSAGSAPR